MAIKHLKLTRSGASKLDKTRLCSLLNRLDQKYTSKPSIKHQSIKPQSIKPQSIKPQQKTINDELREVLKNILFEDIFSYQYEEKYYNNLIKKYTFIKLVGKGTYGSAFLVINNKNERAIVKIQKIQRVDFLREVVMHKRLDRLGLAPKFYGADIWYNCGIIEMEEMDGILYNFLLEKRDDKTLDNILSQLKSLLIKKNKEGIIHGDLHTGNIAYKYQKDGELKVYMIDFGFSCCMFTKQKYDIMEIYQLYGSLFYSMNSYNKKYLYYKMITWNDVFHSDLQKTLKKFKFNNYNHDINIKYPNIKKLWNEWFDIQNRDEIENKDLENYKTGKPFNISNIVNYNI